MNHAAPSRGQQAAFTLLEMIAALVLVAILSLLFLTVFTSSTLMSSNNSARLVAAFDLRTEAERLIASGEDMLANGTAGEDMADLVNALQASVAPGYTVNFATVTEPAGLPDNRMMQLSHPQAGSLVYIFWSAEEAP